MGLAEKPSSCVLWIQFDNDTLELGPFLFFGNMPGLPLPTVSDLKVGKHTKGDSHGVKAERPGIRLVPKSRFRRLTTVAEVFDELFGSATTEDRIEPDALQLLQDGLHKVIHSRLIEFELGGDDLILPRLITPLPRRGSAIWFVVPGMYGGFSYWAEGEGKKTRLIIESWSRVEGGSGQRHEVVPSAVRLMEEGFV